MAIPDFPQRPDIIGFGLSDWLGYAPRLAQKLNYTNTFYHQEPFLDIVSPPSSFLGLADFLISTDVFEHVPPSVQRAFDGSFALLKPGGLLVLTVPFTDVVKTVEHFPDLEVFKVVNLVGDYVLINKTAAGAISLYDNLVFHGGPGDTLEMRVFSRADTIKNLEASGFVDVVVHEEASVEWGIIPPHHHGLPVTARKPLTLMHT